MHLTRGSLIISTCLVLSLGAMLNAETTEQPYQVEWIRQIGTSSDDRGYSVAVDAVGNAYISGFTWGSLCGPNAGGYDAYLAKFDPAGNVLWSTQIGTSSWDSSLSVAVDASGNAYISGPTEGSLGKPIARFDDAFLTKFDPSGNELWSTQIGTMDREESWAVAVDATGNAYISGWTLGSFNGPNAGSIDAYLAKFDPSGNELWTTQIGTASGDVSYAVALDAAGNAYISGYTTGNLGGPKAGMSDAFLTIFDPSGNELWSRQIGTTWKDHSRSVAVDSTGNAYISGYTTGDLGGPNAGDHDAFLTKFDPSGNELWSTQIGTADYDAGYSVAVDAQDNIYISGDTSGNLGGTNAGYADAFLAKFDPSGNELWSTQIGTSDSDFSESVVVDATGNIYISGTTRGDLGGPNAGDRDAFLAKFTIPEPATLALLALGAPALLRRR